jgi:hypothetical protein
LLEKSRFPLVVPEKKYIVYKTSLCIAPSQSYRQFDDLSRLIVKIIKIVVVPYDYFMLIHRPEKGGTAEFLQQYRIHGPAIRPGIMME